MKTHENSIAVQKEIEQLEEITNDVLIANKVCEIMVANDINTVEELLSHLDVDIHKQKMQAVRLLKAIGGLENPTALNSKVQLQAMKMRITLTFNKEVNKLFSDLLSDKQKYKKLVSFSKKSQNTISVVS